MSVEATDSPSHVLVYRSQQKRFRRSQDWRWRFTSPNGNTLADSGEGYANLGDLYAALALVLGVDTMAVQDPESWQQTGFSLVLVVRQDGKHVWVTTRG